ncbi:MAG: IS5 family transposase [Synechococcaceae cyanobacterium MAG-AL1]|nr:IS5 family transposase [Candidatus Regnicoccus frigidus MAG-AL1]
MGQRGFWDEQQRVAKLKDKKPVLRRLANSIPWELFRPLLDKGYSQERKSNAGRKRIDPLILFKMLVLQQLFNLSDEELEFQVNDRRSFEEFVGLGVMNDIPDATTVAFFRERLRKAGVIEELFEMFEAYLMSQGLQARGGQIIDATLVPVPKQRNTREENTEIKADRLPEGWDENADRLQQKDLDARWVKKNGISYYGYKNSICVDVDHGFIRRYAVTPANIHDSQMLPRLLDPENEHDYVWADSAYSGECFQDLLNHAGFESLIHEKGSRNHPLGDAAKELNRVKSAIRACVEHVFGYMTMCMGGKLTRKIGLERTEAWWGLKNLTFNFLRYLHRSCDMPVVA